MAGTLACAASLAITAGAQAAPQTFYFECTGAAPLQTVDVSDYSWSPTAPTKSVQDGAGCGWLDVPLFYGTSQPNPFYDAAFGGMYKGEIKKAELTIYGPELPGVNDKTADIFPVIDGEMTGPITVTPTVAPGPTQGVSEYTFALPVGSIDVPASRSAKSIVFGVTTHYANGTPGWFEGAKEVPSSAKLYGYDDLTCEEQQELDETVVCPE